MNRETTSGTLASRVLPGLLVAVVGLILLLHNLELFPLGSLRRFWPLLLVAFGLHLARQRADRVIGLLLAAAGVVLQLTTLDLIDIRWRTLWSLWRFWPVILIAVGVSMMIRQRDNMIGGAVVASLGVYFLASNFYVIDFEIWRLWPIAVIALGFSMMRRSRGR